MKKTVFTIFALLGYFCGNAQNPIISQRYTADPVGIEYNGRLYLYTSHDIDGQKRYWMNDITCLSTDDMQNWTDHGEVLKAPEDMPWVTQAWAPTIVERNDTFYLYTGDGNRSISVAVCDSPTGHFKGHGGKSLITKELENANVEWCFDPTVFIDEDGQAYCVFGGGPAKFPEGGTRPKNARIIKLGNDLTSTHGPAITIDAPGFYEGGYIHYNIVNGKKHYYFSYFNTGSRGMNIDYMMSDNPLSGWEYKGTVLEQPKDNFNNSHASIFPFKNKWYMAYHTRKIATDRGVDAMRQRSVCIDELHYNEDGTIQPLITTRKGPEQIKNLNPYLINQAETMAAQSYMLPGIETDSCFDKGNSRMVTEISNGDWIKISGVDFNKGTKRFSARVAAANEGTIEIRLDGDSGKIVGVCNVKSTGGLNKWKTQKCKIDNISGTHDLYLKFTGENEELFNLNWWKFTAK